MMTVEPNQNPAVKLLKHEGNSSLHLNFVVWCCYKFRSGQLLIHTMKIIKPLAVLGLA